MAAHGGATADASPYRGSIFPMVMPSADPFRFHGVIGRSAASDGLWNPQVREHEIELGDSSISIPVAPDPSRRRPPPDVGLRMVSAPS